MFKVFGFQFIFLNYMMAHPHTMILLRKEEEKMSKYKSNKRIRKWIFRPRMLSKAAFMKFICLFLQAMLHLTQKI